MNNGRRIMQWNTFRATQAAGYIFIILSIVNWSGNFVASRGLAGVAEPAVLTLMRWALATALFAPFGLAAFWRERAEIFKLFLPLSVIALCGVSLYDTLIFLAGQSSEALNMSLISTLSPLLTALASQFFLGQRVGTKMYIGIAVSTFGVCLLVTDGNLARLATLRFAQGDLIILLTAMMSAVYNLTVKAVSGRVSQTALLMACCLFGTAYLVPVTLWEGGGRIVLPAMTATLAGGLVYLAVFASLLCYLLWNMAVEALGAARTTMFYYALPPLSGLAAWVVLGETVSANQLLSGFIILAGIMAALYADASILKRRGAGKHEFSEVVH
jgi:drug/metabolite transporter (DMT)-like permease